MAMAACICPAIPLMDNESIHVVTKNGEMPDGLMRNQDARGRCSWSDRMGNFIPA